VLDTHLSARERHTQHTTHTPHTWPEREPHATYEHTAPLHRQHTSTHYGRQHTKVECTRDTIEREEREREREKQAARWRWRSALSAASRILVHHFASSTSRCVLCLSSNPPAVLIGSFPSVTNSLCVLVSVCVRAHAHTHACVCAEYAISQRLELHRISSLAHTGQAPERRDRCTRQGCGSQYAAWNTSSITDKLHRYFGLTHLGLTSHGLHAMMKTNRDRKKPAKCLSEAAWRAACCSLIRRSCPLPHHTQDSKDTTYETKDLQRKTCNERLATKDIHTQHQKTT